jgi:hypothetical protein
MSQYLRAIPETIGPANAAAYHCVLESLGPKLGPKGNPGARPLAPNPADYSAVGTPELLGDGP